MCLTADRPRFKTEVWRNAERKALPASFPVSPWAWRLIYESLMKGAGVIVADLNSGELEGPGFFERWNEQMSDGHSQAWYAGRQLAGDDSPFDLADTLVGRAAADADSKFLHNFMVAIQGGEYGQPGELNDVAILNRMSLYAKRTRGTANEALVMASDGHEFYWDLGSGEHCPDCIDLSALNPWEPDEVYANPGDGSTVCITNCRCRWRRSDGLLGFAPI